MLRRYSDHPHQLERHILSISGEVVDVGIGLMLEMTGLEERGWLLGLGLERVMS
jgi:hypothetical protein